MKKSFLPFTLLLVAGCGSQQAPQTADAPPATNAALAPASTPESTPTPKLAYRVVDEAKPDMSPETVKALAKAKMPPPPASFKVPDNAKVELQTSKGNITVQLDTKGAPLHAKSFYYLSSKGYFNGTTFHRWANLMEGSGKPGYIIQGGDPLTKSPATSADAGRGGPGYQIPREHNSSVHDAMVLAAARTADPDSAGSQFYITQNPVYFLDQGDGYTVFGKVVAGKDVALKLKQDDVVKKAVVK